MGNTLAYREQITTATNGTPVFVRRWEIQNPQSTVLVVHGYGDHCGRYAELARALNDAGHHVVAYDQRGAGRSGGEGGRVLSYRDLVADLSKLIGMIQAEYGLPVDLFGHSFGGVQCVLHCTSRPANSDETRVRSVVLSSPAFRIKSSPLLQPFAGLLARLAPTLPTPAIDRNVISRDPDVVRAAQSDPLVHNGKVDALTGAELVRAGRSALSAAPSFSLPLLAFHGSADQLTDSKATKAFVARASSSIKSFHLLDGLRHETFNEPEKESVFQLVASFLDSRAKD